MKVYTKTGDKGSTSLVGGQRIAKNDLRIEAYGTTDELVAHIAYLRDILNNEPVCKELVQIQDDCMVIGSLLATHPTDTHLNLPHVKETNITFLEKAMDKMDEELEPLKRFVVPGGHMAVSYCHIVRTVCRRAERIIVALNETQDIPSNVIEYINRLSDYFFVLSRYLTKVYKVEEIPWEPRLEK